MALSRRRGSGQIRAAVLSTKTPAASLSERGQAERRAGDGRWTAGRQLQDTAWAATLTPLRRRRPRVRCRAGGDAGPSSRGTPEHGGRGRGGPRICTAPGGRGLLHATLRYWHWLENHSGDKHKRRKVDRPLSWKCLVALALAAPLCLRRGRQWGPRAETRAQSGRSRASGDGGGPGGGGRRRSGVKGTVSLPAGPCGRSPVPRGRPTPP